MENVLQLYGRWGDFRPTDTSSFFGWQVVYKLLHPTQKAPTLVIRSRFFDCVNKAYPPEEFQQPSTLLN